MTTKQKTIKTIKFYLANRGKWISFSNDADTINIICRLANLQIVTVNQYGQARINPHNAELYLSAQ
jgi:hypothetical protein